LAISSKGSEKVGVLKFFILFLKSTIYYMGCGCRLWYLQCRYLNTTRNKEKERERKEKLGGKEIAGNTILH